MSSETDAPIVIVGAGLAGLSCGWHLQQHGQRFVIYEASDRVGGRVATDVVDGFLLDRGFQVLLTAYPLASKMLNINALTLRGFYPGALIQVQGRTYRFADPLRKPLSGLGSLFAPVASFVDALRIAKLRWSSAGAIADPGVLTNQYLSSAGFSNRVMERFFKPFFGGVFLDQTLSVPAAFFKFLFRTFGRGVAALPENGMQAIPQQLAATLPSDVLHLRTQVRQARSDHVILEDGQRVDARAVVIATPSNVAEQWVGGLPQRNWNSTVTLYYAAQRSPLKEPILMLNGDGDGLVNHICVPSDVQRSYAPTGKSLVSVSVVGQSVLDDRTLDEAVRQQLIGWCGQDVREWELLRLYRIEQALPHMSPPVAHRTAEGLFICGDYTTTPSIEGALLSGELVARELFL